jgi:hypothetical protein
MADELDMEIPASALTKQLIPKVLGPREIT